MDSIERRVFIKAAAAGAIACTVGSGLGRVTTVKCARKERRPRRAVKQARAHCRGYLPVRPSCGSFRPSRPECAELLVEAINAGGELPAPYSFKGFAGGAKADAHGLRRGRFATRAGRAIPSEFTLRALT